MSSAAKRPELRGTVLIIRAAILLPPLRPCLRGIPGSLQPGPITGQSFGA